MPAAEICAARFDRAVITLGHPCDEVVSLCRLRRRDHIVKRRFRRAISDILAHAAAEQDRLLQHHADLPAQRLRIPLAHIHAIHQHRASIDIIETRDQVHQRALASAGRSQQRNLLTRLHAEADALQHIIAADRSRAIR